MTRLIFFITLYSELEPVCVCINYYLFWPHLLTTTDHAHIPLLFSHFDLMSQTVREHYWNIIIEGNLLMCAWIINHYNNINNYMYKYKAE